MFITVKMKKCIIVGSVKNDAFKVKEKAPDTLYIAADGGYEQMKGCGISPDVLLGDFDSLADKTDFPEKTEIIKYPIEKDDTDTLLAVKEAIKRGCDEITLYGALGGERFDHSIATLQTLTYAARSGVKITAVGESGGKPYFVTAVKDSQIEFPPDYEGTLSVMCADGHCQGVTVENAKYCTENAVMTPSFPIGVSNSFIKGKSARISVKKGTLWVFY